VPEEEPDWSACASQYDLMAEINPAYQQLVTHCIDTARRWELRSGQVLADFCAGTGNFSIPLAWTLPGLTVLHIERNPDMMRRAETKARDAALHNWHAISLDLSLPTWPIPPLAGAVATHCIYTFPKPQDFIRRLCAHLDERGFIYACDVGRVFNLIDWAWFLVKASLASRGLLQTAKLLTATHLIRRQNQIIAKAQRTGAFWTHNLFQFRSCFEVDGMKALAEACDLYHGYDDLVVAQENAPRLE
jgi:hypothetical protein